MKSMNKKVTHAFAVQYNYQKLNNIGSTFDIYDFYFYLDGKLVYGRDHTCYLLMIARTIHDMVASMVAGVIPLLTSSGTDSFGVYKGIKYPVELKTSFAGFMFLGINIQGNINYKVPTMEKPIGLTSKIKATFTRVRDSEYITEKKNETTRLAAFVDPCGYPFEKGYGVGFVGTWELNPDQTVELLLAKKINKSGTIGLSLSNFIKHGIMLEDENAIGIDGLKMAIKERDKYK